MFKFSIKIALKITEQVLSTKVGFPDVYNQSTQWTAVSKIYSCKSASTCFHLDKHHMRCCSLGDRNLLDYFCNSSLCVCPRMSCSWSLWGHSRDFGPLPGLPTLLSQDCSLTAEGEQQCTQLYSSPVCRPPSLVMIFSGLQWRGEQEM